MTVQTSPTGTIPAAGEWSVEAWVSSLVESGGHHGVTVHPGDVWVTVLPERSIAEHGWKLHVSARAVSYREVAETVVPMLLERGTPFKMAASVAVLADLNDGLTSPASVGKAFTVYPDPDDALDVGTALAEALRGRTGPRILSDRQVLPDAPVYYRYGPFAPRWTAGARGTLSMQITGPDGEAFDAVASLEYRQPVWADDPFDVVDDTLADLVLGGRYEVSSGLWQSSRGNVFRGVDLTTGTPVVVKQARAMVAESLDGSVDARMRLRNERRLLSVLEDVPDVARVVDHFEQGGDEYLVTTDLGATNLADHASLEHPYRLRDAPGAAVRASRLRRLARDLARQLLVLHAHDVVMRDLTPRNVVVDGDGRARIIDFGISAHDGTWLPGGTPGFAPERQLDGAPPRTADDAHGLAMTLFFAAVGMNPVESDVPGLAARRVLETLAETGRESSAPDPTLAFLEDLLSGDDEVAGAALVALAADDDASAVAVRPAVPVALSGVAGTGDPGRRADLLLDRVLAGAGTVCAAGPSSIWAVDTSVYTGAAGMLRELVHHRGRDGVAPALADLDRLCTAATLELDLGPGLYVGTTGIEVVRAEAALAGIRLPSADDAPPPRVRPEQWADLEGDVMYGLAGVALGELHLGALTGDPSHAEVAHEVLGVLLTSRDHRISEPSEPAPAGSGADSVVGYAHGLAGVHAAVLAAHAVDPARYADARSTLSERLRGETRRLITEARSPVAVPLAAGWCQGLAGIASVLLLDSDPDSAELASDALATCRDWVPWVANPTQCCGLVGIGQAFLDAADALGDPAWVDAALGVSDQLARRSGVDDPDAPGYLDPTGDGVHAWGLGLTGALAFHRRLAAAAGA